jgi:small subunit ribosomal protein S3
MPLSTIRADIDYAHEIARTKSGVIGVRVWINRGEIFKKGLDNQVPVYAKKLNPRKGDYR